MPDRPDGLAIAAQVLEDRPDASLGLVAGSVARGTAGPDSDLDLLVVLPAVPAARRVTLAAGGWTVELFVHDPETLEHYLRRLEPRSGIPAHATMLAEAVAVVDRAPGLLDRLRATAAEVLAAGPLPFPRGALDQARYQLTAARARLLRPCAPEDLRSLVAQLHRPLAETWLRGRRRWFAEDRRLRECLWEDDPAFGDAMDEALRAVGQDLDPGPTVAVIDRVLDAIGGPLRAGYGAVAPADWRVTGGAR